MADRITPFEPGMKIEDRIDEIALSSVDSVCFEMLDDCTACMWVDDRMFAIYVRKGELICALREGAPVEAPPRAMLDVGRNGA